MIQKKGNSLLVAAPQIISTTAPATATTGEPLMTTPAIGTKHHMT